MKPVILITYKTDPDPDNFGVGKLYSQRSNYCRAIIRAGGVPVIAASADATEYAAMADGLLIPGGSNDVEPEFYGETNRKAYGCDRDIDVTELALFREFYDQNKPILGICRGHQVINVAMGGTLLQDLIEDHPMLDIHKEIVKKNTAPVHTVKTMSNSLLNQLFGDTVTTNSHHHQAVKDCGTGMFVSAMSEDGIVEAIQHETLPIFGIQWHPERMIGEENLNLTNMEPLFKSFIDRCK